MTFQEGTLLKLGIAKEVEERYWSSMFQNCLRTKLNGDYNLCTKIKMETM